MTPLLQANTLWLALTETARTRPAATPRAC
jgi:hypothetical protein